MGRWGQTPVPIGTGQPDDTGTTQLRSDDDFCAPSRAAILTGTYNHVNDVTTLATPLDNTLWTFPKALQDTGYTTGMIGKWHLGHGPGADPTGFDFWQVLPGQGHYHNPVMLRSNGEIFERGATSPI